MPSVLPAVAACSLCRRCGIAPTYAGKLVTVMRDLQRLRQGSNVFAGKHGLITPRDLFRYQALGFAVCWWVPMYLYVWVWMFGYVG